MAYKTQPMKRIFHRRGSEKTVFPHLKPLSIYSRMVISDAIDSLSPIPSWTTGDPFCNFRVELVNTSSSSICKRQLDDSCLDETYETPPKKPCLAKCYSPDLGCVLDSFETSEEVKNSTPKLPSSIVLNKVNKIESRTNRIFNQSDSKVKPVQKSDCSDETGGRSSVALNDARLISPTTVEKKDATEVGPAFSFDVDEILCLNSFDQDGAGSDGLEDFIQSCQTFHEEQQSRSRSFCNDSKHNHDQNEGLCCKNKCDEGYVTKCYRKESPQMSKETTNNDNTHSYKTAALNDKTPPVSQTIPPLMSTPLARFQVLVKQSPLLKPVLGPEEEQVSPILNHQPLKASTAQTTCTSLKFMPNTKMLPIISFLNDEEGTLSVGTSIDKSLVRHIQQQETGSSVKEDVVDTVSVSQKVGPQFQETSYETSCAESSFDTTMPLHVQVKSKVVLLSKQQPDACSITAVKATEPQQPERKVQYVIQRVVHKEDPRPLVFGREEDWEREKRVYVDSVTRHMKDNAGAGDGVMAELLHLMNAVANQRAQSDGRQWQHPSDLSSRNYQLRNRGRLLSLDEWQNLNMCKFRRFAKVPQKFKRSPVL
ncbi:S100P-binding protein-like [Trichomycterus rosablanca]|uniref:S100P-binding protein-like n=1 Tax=Trichomycterus rosablanca TaxID=2290929 RepID=UPI002F3504A8